MPADVCTAAEADVVTVITLARGNVAFLRRAVASVLGQDYSGKIEHLIVADDCDVDAAEIMPRQDVSGAFGQRILQIERVARRPDEIPEPSSLGDVYPHLARLWNHAVRLAKGAWISFLDDDNAFEPNHISTLVARTQSCAVRAVHSSRVILRADGSPYLDEIFPWAPDPESGRRIHTDLRSRGVWPPGTNICHDRAGPLGFGPMRNSTVMTAHDPVVLVDMSAWLLHRDVLAQFPVPEVMTDDDVRDRTAPDDKLLEVLLRNRIPIVSTGKPTMHYYLGGISNQDGR